MWFKNARIYTIKLDEECSQLFKNESLLEERISKEFFRPTTAKQMESTGFAPIYGRNTEAYTFNIENNHFFKIIEENKILPSSVVNQALLDEIEVKEQSMNRTLNKSEKQALKEALLNRMCAQAFATRKELLIWVNSQHGFVAVSASSAKRAENAIGLLRKALGSFPAKPLQPRCVVEDRLTNFLTKKDFSKSFVLGFDAVLKSTDDDGGTVRISREELTAEEVLNHIQAGKIVSELQLNLNECVSFVVTADLSCKRIAINDQYIEVNLPQKTDDKIADMQGFLMIQADILQQIAQSLYQTFDCDA